MAFRVHSHWQVHDDAGRRKYLNSAERDRFLVRADAFDPETRALCHLLAYSGCRISEALALTRDHLDTERGTVTVRTLKQRRAAHRIVPLPDVVLAMLLALPVQADGRFWTMHRTTAWRRLKRAMQQVGILGPMATCKGLRHGFGMRAAGRNVPPNLIQRWLGHTDPSTTAVYLDAVGLEERAFAARMW